jgi:hypothetical protein
MGACLLIAAVAHPAPSQLFLAAAWGLIVAVADGQPAAPADTAVVPPIFTSAAAAGDAPATSSAAATSTVAEPHALSPELAATISTALPQYQDASTPSAAANPKVDQPKNQIPRLPIVTLPQVTVREKRIREFTERESYTKQGLRELAEKRYMSWLDHLLYNQGIPGFMTPEGLAMAKFNAAEDRARAKEMADLGRLDAMKDPDEMPPAKSP